MSPYFDIYLLKDIKKIMCDLKGSLISARLFILTTNRLFL